jgi:DNA invertase Pin-like site-specific DNA recombinase
LPGARAQQQRAAIYARVSSQEQKRGYSLQAQVRDDLAYCDRQGYEVVRVLKEVGKRRNMARDRLEILLHAAERRQYEVLVVWKRDRFGAGRDVDLVERFLRSQGVRVEALSTGPQSNTATTRFMNGVMDLVADFELDTIGERCHMGRLEAARRGRWPIAVHYGYQRVYPSKDVVVDPAKAAIVRRAFELCAAGKTLREITDACGWADHQKALRRLHDSMYKGEGTYSGIVVPMPVIVEPDLWQRAQDAIALRKRNHMDEEPGFQRVEPEERIRAAGPLAQRRTPGPAAAMTRQARRRAATS